MESGETDKDMHKFMQYTTYYALYGRFWHNLQFKVACVLKNIRQMVESQNIEVLPHHMLWYIVGFEFPKRESKLDQVFMSMSKIKADAKINEMKHLQQQIFNLNLSEDTEISLEEGEDENIVMREAALKYKKHTDNTVIPVIVFQKNI